MRKRHYGDAFSTETLLSHRNLVSRSILELRQREGKGYALEGLSDRRTVFNDYSYWPSKPLKIKYPLKGAEHGKHSGTLLEKSSSAESA